MYDLLGHVFFFHFLHMWALKNLITVSNKLKVIILLRYGVSTKLYAMPAFSIIDLCDITFKSFQVVH